METNHTIEISEHAYLRMKERNGWSKKTANRMVSRIYDSGKRPTEVKGYLKAWVNKKMQHSEYDDRIFILYGQKLYIFSNGCMVTVLHTPSKEQVIKTILA